MNAEPTPLTVAEALAMAEAWNERAAMLSTLAFELRGIFAPLPDGGPPAYLVTRISGGVGPVNPAVVEDVRAELFCAAERARDQARRILASAAAAPMDGHARSVGDQGDVTPSVDYASIRIPTGGYDIVANPNCPPARRKLGDGPRPTERGDDVGDDGVDVVPVAAITPLRPRKRPAL